MMTQEQGVQGTGAVLCEGGILEELRLAEEMGTSRMRQTPNAMKVAYLGGGNLGISYPRGVIYNEGGLTGHTVRTRWVVRNGITLAITGCTKCGGEYIEVMDLHLGWFAQGRVPGFATYGTVLLALDEASSVFNLRFLAELMSEARLLFAPQSAGQ